LKQSIITNEINKLNSTLEYLGANENAEKYISKCIKLSLVFAILSWLLWNLFFESFIEGILFSSIITTALFLVLIKSPEKRKKKRAGEIEKHLPFALMQLSVELNIGLSFDYCLARISKADYGALSEEVKKAILSKKTGKSITNALEERAKKTGSLIFKRSVSHLISIYTQGSKNTPGETIRRIALEQLSRQKAEAKVFSEKIVMISLAFIVISAIVPALFQAFVVVGSSFMEIGFGDFEVLIITGILFPLLDISAILYIINITPEFLKG